jgi:hypothetical protein
MGNHSAHLKCRHAAALVLLLPLSCAQAQPGDKAMSDVAETYIRAIENGEKVSSPPSALMPDGQPSPAALERFRRELLSAGGPVREGVVNLLVDLGIQSDPLVHRNVSVLRSPALIGILINEGCNLPDQGCLAALDGLRLNTPGELLKPHGARLAEILRRQPSDAVLLTVAKAKATEALDLVKPLAVRESAQRALAALGDADRERALADAIDAAQTGEALADALAKSALVGTDRLIRKIGEQMRTPLTLDVRGAYIASVRLNVLDALRYNFPQVPEFYAQNIMDDGDYLKVEEMLTRDFGVVFHQPRPEFMKLIGYPRLPPLQ